MMRLLMQFVESDVKDRKQIAELQEDARKALGIEHVPARKARPAKT
jgi:hypothetical protein